MDGGHMEPERYAIATRDVSAALYLQVESALTTLGAVSGCVLLPTKQSIADGDLATSGTGGMSGVSPMSPPLSSPPTPSAEAQLALSTHSSGADHKRKVTNMLRIVSQAGPMTSTFSDERLHKGVLQTGLAINGTSAATQPFLCFPIASTGNFRKRLGLFMVSGKVINTGSTFTPDDEAVMALLCRSLSHIVTSYQLDMVSEPFDGQQHLEPLRRSDTTGIINQPLAPTAAVASPSGGGGGGPEEGNENQIFDAAWQINHQKMQSVRQQVFRTATSGSQLMRLGALAEACDIPTVFQLHEISCHFQRLEDVLVDQRNAVTASDTREELSQSRIKALQTDLLREGTKVKALQAELETTRTTNNAYKSQLSEARRNEIEERQNKAVKLTHTQRLEQEISNYLGKQKKSMALAAALQQKKDEKEKERNRFEELLRKGEGISSTMKPPAPTNSTLRSGSAKGNISRNLMGSATGPRKPQGPSVSGRIGSARSTRSFDSSTEENRVHAMLPARK